MTAATLPVGSLAIVSCADSGEVHTLSLDPGTGQLRPRQVLALGGTLMPMALHPQLARLYVARRSEPLAVCTVAIARDGSLEAMGEAPLPQSMAYLGCDRGGHWWLAASYGADCVAIGAIDGQGLARAASHVLPTGRHAHAIVADPANRFVYSTALGGDRLHRFVLDAQAGTLRPAEPPVHLLQAGAGPRHLVFGAGGERLYVLNELDGGIDVLTCEPTSGALHALQRVSCLPPDFKGAPWAAELRLSPDGRWLLATERRSSTLSVFAVVGQGELELRSQTSVEDEPRGMQLDPSGRYVLVAGQRSHHVASFALDVQTGALAACDRVRVGLNPNWIETLPLPA